LSFPYKNIIEQTLTERSDPEGDEKITWFESFQAELDVSGLTLYGQIIGSYAAHDSNKIDLGLVDTGPTGSTTAVVLATTVDPSDGWVDLVPRALTMSTSADDVDKGDWLTANYDESGTLTITGFALHLAGTYGIPGGIS
jgi:hypothetical protein